MGKTKIRPALVSFLIPTALSGPGWALIIPPSLPHGHTALQDNSSSLCVGWTTPEISSCLGSQSSTSEAGTWCTIWEGEGGRNIPAALWKEFNYLLLPLLGGVKGSCKANACIKERKKPVGFPRIRLQETRITTFCDLSLTWLLRNSIHGVLSRSAHHEAKWKLLRNHGNVPTFLTCLVFSIQPEHPTFIYLIIRF